MSRFTIALIATLFVAAAFAQNTTTVAPANTTVAATPAPNATTTVATNATTTVAPATTTTAAPVNSTTTAAPGNATTTPAANATIAPTATPTPTEAFSPAVTVALNTTLAAFNGSDFIAKTAALLNVNASKVEIVSTTAGSVIVVFRVRSASAQSAAALAETFRTTYASNAAFTNAYRVLSVSVAATPAPVALVYSNPITVSLDTTVAVFNAQLFREKAAAVVGIVSDNIQIISAAPGSVIVIFRIAASSAANAHSLATVFKNTVAANSGFTGAYRVLAVSYSAAAATNVFFAVILAVLLVACRLF